MVISELRGRVSGFFNVAWFCVSAAVAIVGLVNGVFVMIRDSMVGGEYCSEFGGVYVYFDSVSLSAVGGVNLHRSGVLVAYIFKHNPDFEDRVEELKSLRLLK